MSVEFHNPGIKEVLTRYICSNDRMRMLLLDNAFYVEQVFGALIEDSRYGSPIEASSVLQRFFFLSFERIWNDFKSCGTSLHRVSSTVVYYDHSSISKAEALLRLQSRYLSFVPQQYYVENKMTQQVMTDNRADLYSLLTLLEIVDLSQTTLDFDGLYKDYSLRLYSVEDCLDFAKSIERVFPDHLEFLDSEEFCDIATECLKQELNYTRDTDLDELESVVDSLCRYIPYLESETVVDDLKKRRDAYIDEIESQAEAYQDDYPYASRYIGSEEWRIDNLFATIK